jgi:hypothetical protein
MALFNILFDNIAGLQAVVSAQRIEREASCVGVGIDGAARFSSAAWRHSEIDFI